MAIRIVGNNHKGTYHTWNDVDNEDPNATLYYEEVMPFTPHVLVYPLYGNITAYYYKYQDTVGVEDSYPALYADNNGQPGEKLTKDEPLMRTRWWTGDREGWVQAVVRMRRTVALGEKVWFGFFGYMIAPRYDTHSVQTVWLSEWDYNIDVGSPPTEHIASPYKDYRPPMRLSMYFSYSDVSPSVNYVRRVSDIARGTARFKYTRLKYSRFAKLCTIGGSDNTQRVQTLVRKCTAFCSVVDFLARRHMLFRQMTSLASGVSKLTYSRGFFCTITSHANGFAKVSYLHGVGVFVQSLVVAFDGTKTGMCIRRLIFTVCGLWERLLGRKGVHRVEIVLYSPITLELKLGGKRS